jgi:hypothetical protein
MVTQRTVIMTGMLAAVVLGYLAYGSFALGWFSSGPIQIMAIHETPPRTPPQRRRGADLVPAPAPPRVKSILFGMDTKYYLTSIRVEPVVTGDEIDSEDRFTLPSDEPMWHVVAVDGGPSRIQRFHYGQRIEGMTAAEEGPRRARPLEPGKLYRIIIEAGKRRGEMEFEAQAAR